MVLVSGGSCLISNDVLTALHWQSTSSLNRHALARSSVMPALSKEMFQSMDLSRLYGYISLLVLSLSTRY